MLSALQVASRTRLRRKKYGRLSSIVASGNGNTRETQSTYSWERLGSCTLDSPGSGTSIIAREHALGTRSASLQQRVAGRAIARAIMLSQKHHQKVTRLHTLHRLDSLGYVRWHACAPENCNALSADPRLLPTLRQLDCQRRKQRSSSQRYPVSHAPGILWWSI